MEINVWIISTCDNNDGIKPIRPEVFISKEKACVRLLEIMRDFWVAMASFRRMPVMPDEWDEAQDILRGLHTDGSWCEYLLTEHAIDLRHFCQQMPTFEMLG